MRRRQGLQYPGELGAAGLPGREPLELRCAIEAQNVAERFFSLSWVFSSSPVALVGPNAVPVFSGDYAAREAAGQLTARKESPSVHLLRLQHLRAEDSGKYICRVTERERTPTGEFVDRTKRSRNVQISVQPLKSNISVLLFSNSSEVQEGDPLALSCSVRGRRTGGGSVRDVGVGGWAWREAQELASVDRDGTVRAGPSYRERSSYGGRRGTVPLHRHRVAAAPLLAWEKIGQKTGTKTLTVRAIESSFFIAASSRTPSVTFGDSFDLQCVVKLPPRAPLSVTWHFQPPEGVGPPRELVTLSLDGTLQWGEQLGGWAIRASLDRSSSNRNFRLSVSRAGLREAGTYQCSAHLWRLNYDGTWARVANRTSNLLGISVLKPVSRLRVQKANQSLWFVEDSSVRVNCSVEAQTSPYAQHAVLWYARKGPEPHSAPELLLKTTRPAGLQYELSDSGAYYCQVEEWLLDPEGSWYHLARDTSGFTQVFVTQPETRLQVEETVSNLTVSEAGSIRLGCSILSQSSQDSRFSVSWYLQRTGGAREGVEPQCVFSIGHDAVFGNGNCSPAEPWGPESRLLFQRTTSDLYSLTIQRARPEDSGKYYCHVQEWLLNPRNAWYRLTANNSGLTAVTVHPAVPSLQSVVCSSESLFYFVFFYPFPIFGALLIALLLVRYKTRQASRGQDGKNGAPLLWIKEPHLNYSPPAWSPGPEPAPRVRGLGPQPPPPRPAP
ncbi:hypothetical protein ANANG_G00052950 [Anguilla anguilla]|uniref:Ig-like domain-containing protein n=1 Tax=Anguilla anguilla TaxID=7936 RepID=A0A9D3MRU8_ANGAN|nr:hypothetical protein ANANG_G00052950 [Anguilla anguilla]